MKNSGRSAGVVRSSNFASARNPSSITVFKVFRMTGKPGSAGINRQVVGDEGTLQERKTANRLASSLAGEIARCCLKRRQGIGGSRWRFSTSDIFPLVDLAPCLIT